MKELVSIVIVVLMHSSILFGQQLMGKVTDAFGLPLSGVNIMVQETSRGTSTDIEGKFSIEVFPNEVLEFSYLGYENYTMVIKDQTNIEVFLVEQSTALEEVVVTSLGIKKEKRALGYAVSKLESNDIVRVRVNNVVNALAGQMPGVQITGANNGLASSSRIVIRGESSLNINSNQPLFILDGVPVNNRIFGVGGSATDQGDLPTDYGNGIADLNPEDFESVTVLKGAAASALYGERAANGVVVITTKTGTKYQDDLGVEISLSTTISKRMDLFELQDQYGAGWNGNYASDFGTNYGPRLDGALVNQELSLGEFVERPFINRFNLDDLFRTGVNHFRSVSVSGANDKGHFRLSYGNTDSQGILPNTDLRGDSFRLNGGYNITDKWKVNASANYIERASDNLPVTGYGSQGLMYTLLWSYLNVGLDELRNYWAIENIAQRKLFSWGDNPWFTLYENINAFEKNRFLGTINSTYQLTDKLSLMARIGVDQSSDFRWSRRSIGTERYRNGMYREQVIDFKEVNADFLFTYKEKFGDVDTRISIGGNRFDQTIKESFLQGNGLAIPGLYNAQNIDVTPVIRNDVFEKRINSLYGFVNMGYKNYLYLDVTGRNDWSSTLPANNNSYFYPAASLSLIPTELFEQPKALDFFKLRYNIAQVGKATDPYRLVNTYNYGTLSGTLTNQSELLNSNLKPERTVSSEYGFESYFLDKRISLDATYYRSVARDQILNVNISQATGFNSTVINAGKIKNTGVEVALGIVPIKKEQFEWRINANYTRNRSKVVSLVDGLDSFVIAEVQGATVEARPGERMGDIYGIVYERNDAGQVIYENGVPKQSAVRKKAGNYNPDYMLGLSTNLNWKGFEFYVLFDIRKGGEIFSYTNAIGRESGIFASTLPYRDGFIGDGVMDDGSGNFVPNNVQIAAESWAFAVSRANADEFLYDASYVKLRQLSLGYSFDKQLLKKFGLTALKIRLIGSNLLLWTDVPNIDPEAQGLNSGTLVPGFEMTQFPTAREYGLNLNLKF